MRSSGRFVHQHERRRFAAQFTVNSAISNLSSRCLTTPVVIRSSYRARRELPCARISSFSQLRGLALKALHQEFPSIAKVEQYQREPLGRSPGPASHRSHGTFAGRNCGLAAVSRDPRISTAIVMDAPVSASSLVATDKPVLILAAGRDEWGKSDCQLWRSLRGVRLLVDFRGAEHLTASDAVWLLRTFPNWRHKPVLWEQRGRSLRCGTTSAPFSTTSCLEKQRARFLSDHHQITLMSL